VTVDDVKQLQARKPYDAPNWVRTDRAVTFAELKTYEQQLQSSGLVPDSINVALNLPPDLYLLRANGIDMNLNYRYTMPPIKDSSRMDISLNDQFLQSFSLNSSQDVNKLILPAGAAGAAGRQNGSDDPGAAPRRHEPAAL
jgi:hypothetical protein